MVKYGYTNLLAMWNFLDSEQRLSCMKRLTNIISEIKSSRSGNGAYFGNSHTSIKDLDRMVGYYLRSEKPIYHVTVDITYKDGSKEHLSK